MLSCYYNSMNDIKLWKIWSYNINFLNFEKNLVYLNYLVSFWSNKIQIKNKNTNQSSVVTRQYTIPVLPKLFRLKVPFLIQGFFRAPSSKSCLYSMTNHKENVRPDSISWRRGALIHTSRYTRAPRRTLWEPMHYTNR
jgi:hypothetical protein